MKNTKSHTSKNGQKYITRNGLKYRIYADGTEAVKLVLTIHNPQFIKKLEKAVRDSGRGKGAANRLTEEFLLDAIRKGHEL